MCNGSEIAGCSDAVKGVAVWKIPFKKPTKLQLLKMWSIILSKDGITGCKFSISNNSPLSDDYGQIFGPFEQSQNGNYGQSEILLLDVSWG